MARTAYFAVDTTLYHPVEGAYTFPAGSPDPGELWTERPGGKPIGENVAAETLKALVTAEETIEQLNRNAEKMAHDLLACAKERDEANARAKDAETEAEAARSAKAAAEEAAKVLTEERDAARSELARLAAEKTALKPSKAA